MGDELVALYGQLDRLRAQCSRRLGEFDGRGDARGDGQRSTVGWLAAQCRMDPRDASRDVHMARAMRCLPRLKDGWEDGRTTAAHVQCVARVRHRAKADRLFDALEPTWDRLCREQDTQILGKALAGFVDRLDNTKPAEDTDAVDAIERRMLIGSHCLGAGLIEGRWDTLDYETIWNAIDHQRDRAHVEGDERSIDQERADALVEICLHYTRTHRDTGAEKPPVVNVLSDAPTLAGIEAGLCETDRGLPLHVETVRRLCCSARIGRILVGEDDEILNLGRTKRLFNRAQRRGMLYRDRGCCFPGCPRVARHCEPHHMNEWENGGPTNIENGCLLCYVHHRLVHEQRWTIRRNQHGGIDWHRPDGTHHGTWHPPGRPPPIFLPDAVIRR